jgi:hypothetical protein
MRHYVLISAKVGCSDALGVNGLGVVEMSALVDILACWSPEWASAYGGFNAYI